MGPLEEVARVLSAPPVSGKADKDGYAIQDAKAAGNSLQVVTKASRLVAKVGAGWKTADELGKGKGKVPADLAELLVSRTPGDELQALAAKEKLDAAAP